MRRFLLTLCILALMTPSAVAHAGSQVPPLFVVETEVEPGDPSAWTRNAIAGTRDAGDGHADAV